MKKIFSVFTSLASLCMLLLTLLIGTGCPNPKPEPEICDAPENVQVVAITGTSATLTWTSPPNSTVEISIVPQGNPPGPFTSTTNAITINGLAPETDYTATLRTICTDGSKSEPTSITFRTATIIIGDIIIQREIPDNAKGVCGNANQDQINNSTVITWDESFPLEALKIQHSGAVVFIIKDKTGSTPVYKVLKDNEILCDATTSNSPVTSNSISGGFILNGPSGSGYQIEISATQAKMLVGSTIVGTYSKYR